MAATIETHYDILRVVRTAPVDVIKTSYRVMSQKYHPDRNPAPDALEIMTRINQAWDVLRDPDRRATHDRWIAAQEGIATTPAAARPARPGAARSGHARATPPASRLRSLFTEYGMAIAAVLAAASAICLLLSYLLTPVAMDDDVVAASQPAAALGGDTVWLAKPWEAVPAQRQPHGYLVDEEQYYADGLSTFEIDNTDGDADAEVRLYRNGRAVRSMVVHHGQRFVVEKLPPGTYALKYKIAVAGKMHAYQANVDFQFSEAAGKDPDVSATQAYTALHRIDGGTHEIPLDQI